MSTPDSGADWDHTYSGRVNTEHGAGMDRAASVEAVRTADVASTKASNEWRKGNTFYHNTDFAQVSSPDSGADTTHRYSVYANDANNALNARNAAQEAARVAAVSGQASADAWRKGNNWYHATMDDSTN